MDYAQDDIQELKETVGSLGMRLEGFNERLKNEMGEVKEMIQQLHSTVAQLVEKHRNPVGSQISNPRRRNGEEASGTNGGAEKETGKYGKLELPVFSGEDPLGWFFRVDKEKGEKLPDEAQTDTEANKQEKDDENEEEKQPEPEERGKEPTAAQQLELSPFSWKEKLEEVLGDNLKAKMKTEPFQLDDVLNDHVNVQNMYVKAEETRNEMKRGYGVEGTHGRHWRDCRRGKDWAEASKSDGKEEWSRWRLERVRLIIWCRGPKLNDLLGPNSLVLDKRWITQLHRAVQITFMKKLMGLGYKVNQIFQPTTQQPNSSTSSILMATIQLRSWRIAHVNSNM